MVRNLKLKFDSRYFLPVLLILFSVFYAWITYLLYNESKGLAFTGLVGPCFFPWLISIALGGLSFWELCSVIKAKPVSDPSLSEKEQDTAGIEETSSSIRNLFYRKGYLFDMFFLAIVAIYVVGMPLLGFLPMTVFLMLMMLGIAGEKNVLKLTAYPLLITFLIYYLFVKPLGIPIAFLPWG